MKSSNPDPRRSWRFGRISLILGAAAWGGMLLVFLLSRLARQGCGGPDLLPMFSTATLLALLGIIFGHAARGSKARAGLAASYILLVLAIGFLPNTLRVRCASNDAVAVANLRTLNAAIVTYASAYGSLPPQVEALGPDPSTPSSRAEPSAKYADLIDPVLAGGQKSGYRFVYALGPAGPSGKEYTIQARPLEFGKTGKRNFFTNESGVICATWEDRPATASDSPIN